jgi:hypothetical protein
MNCKKMWSREFLVLTFTKKFIREEYKEHRQQILFEREVSLLPSTQVFAEIVKRCRDIRELLHDLSAKDVELQRLVYETRRLLRETPRGELYEEVEKEGKRRSIAHSENRINMDYLQLELDNLEQRGEKDAQVEKRQFTRKCPRDNCNGFLSTQWKCGLCNYYVCSQCHETKGLEREDTGHVCNENNKLAAQMIERETRPCPQCSARIYKISGCDQMFCTQCNTAFSWTTGKIERGVIHNPHYYQYLRQTQGHVPRNPGDNACGGELQHYQVFRITTAFNLFLERSKAVGRYPEVKSCLTRFLHFRIWEMPRFRVTDNNGNRDMRVQYMLNDIDEVKFKHDLWRREKDRDKNREIYNLLEIFVEVATDVIRRIDSDLSTGTLVTTQVGQYEKELYRIREYVNEQFMRIGRVYTCVTKTITPQWDLSTTKETVTATTE